MELVREVKEGAKQECCFLPLATDRYQITHNREGSKQTAASTVTVLLTKDSTTTLLFPSHYVYYLSIRGKMDNSSQNMLNIHYSAFILGRERKKQMARKWGDFFAPHLPFFSHAISLILPVGWRCCCCI